MYTINFCKCLWKMVGMFRYNTANPQNLREIVKPGITLIRQDKLKRKKCSQSLVDCNKCFNESTVYIVRKIYLFTNSFPHIIYNNLNNIS